MFSWFSKIWPKSARVGCSSSRGCAGGCAGGRCSITRGVILSGLRVGADWESAFRGFTPVGSILSVGLTCCTSSPSSGAGAASESPLKKEDDGVEAPLNRGGLCVSSEAGCSRDLQTSSWSVFPLELAGPECSIGAFLFPFSCDPLPLP